MSTTMLVILGLAALALIIGVILAAGDRPRVTHIETRREKKDESDDA